METQTRENLIAIAKYVAMGYPISVSKDFTAVDGLFVFCREDERIAETTFFTYRYCAPKWILLTGGIGKGSGERSRLFGSEAAHQADLLTRMYGVPSKCIRLETLATNGAENSRLGVEMIRSCGLAHRRIILVMYPRNARRVFAAHMLIARQVGTFTAEYEVICSEDPFDPENPDHRTEVISELLRIADWPAKGWSDPQSDLPLDLVEWARANQ